MRASYDSIDNKQKMCEKVNKDITFIQFFHSTRLHSTELFKIFFSLLTPQLLFLQKASWPGKNQTFLKSKGKFFKNTSSMQFLVPTILPTKITAAENEIALSHHRLRRLYLLVVIFAVTTFRMKMHMVYKS